MHQTFTISPNLTKIKTNQIPCDLQGMCAPQIRAAAVSVCRRTSGCSLYHVYCVYIIKYNFKFNVFNFQTKIVRSIRRNVFEAIFFYIAFDWVFRLKKTNMREKVRNCNARIVQNIIHRRGFDNSNEPRTCISLMFMILGFYFCYLVGTYRK